MYLAVDDVDIMHCNTNIHVTSVILVCMCYGHATFRCRIVRRRSPRLASQAGSRRSLHGGSGQCAEIMWSKSPEDPEPPCASTL